MGVLGRAPGARRIDERRGGGEARWKVAEEWERQVEQWADRYRELLDDVDDVPDRELATIVTEEEHGVALETFEREVVEWSQDEVLQEAVAGPTQALQNAVQEAAQEG